MYVHVHVEFVFIVFICRVWLVHLCLVHSQPLTNSFQAFCFQCIESKLSASIPEFDSIQKMKAAVSTINYSVK